MKLTINIIVKESQQLKPAENSFICESINDIITNNLSTSIEDLNHEVPSNYEFEDDYVEIEIEVS